MVIDYMLGLANAAIFKTSPKSENGALSSKAGLQGIYKKVVMLCLVVVATRIDITFGFDYVRSGVCVALIVNEVVSILETYKLSGLKAPEILLDVIDIVGKNNKGDNNGNIR